MAHPALLLAVGLLPCGADLFCRGALLLAKQLFFKDAPLEDPDRARRRLKSYPCAYPNGWYQVVASRELGVGEVKEVACLGKDFAIFRGRKTGAVGVLDAHCPVVLRSRGCWRVQSLRVSPLSRLRAPPPLPSPALPLVAHFSPRARALAPF